MKFKLYISSPHNCNFSYEEDVDIEEYISREAFEAMTEDKRNEFVHETMLEILFNEYIDFNYEQEEE